MFLLVDIEAGRVEGRGGLLQAAINLEFDAMRFGGISVLTEGINGQLPNLDLVNVVNKLIRDSNIPPAIHGRVGTMMNASDGITEYLLEIPSLYLYLTTDFVIYNLDISVKLC